MIKMIMTYRNYFKITLKDIQRITFDLLTIIIYKNSTTFLKDKKFGQKNQEQ